MSFGRTVLDLIRDVEIGMKRAKDSLLFRFAWLSFKILIVASIIAIGTGFILLALHGRTDLVMYLVLGGYSMLLGPLLIFLIVVALKAPLGETVSRRARVEHLFRELDMETRSTYTGRSTCVDLPGQTSVNLDGMTSQALNEMAKKEYQRLGIPYPD